MDGIIGLVSRGGPAMWCIALLSVGTLALILWKLWRLALAGAWAGAHAERAAGLWAQGQGTEAGDTVAQRRGMRARLVAAAMAARATMPDASAREETERVARAILADARGGLRALDLIATIAPLLGLLGTVLGMIEAFQALQAAGARADPAALAGGIWQALLTTAAGMAVAIPAGVALAYFESVVDRVQGDMEDLATRIFTRGTVAQ